MLFNPAFGQLNPQTAPATQPSASSITAPEFPGSVESLDVYADVGESGTALHLLAGLRAPVGGDRPMTFHHARSLDGGKTWSAPVRVDAGAPAGLRHHRGSDARIVARGEELLAVWTTPGEGAMGTGLLASALSADGGRTWRPGPDPAATLRPGATTRPSGDAAQHGYRFVALAADGRTFHLIWLDANGKERSLWATRSPDAGRTWEPATMVDPLICACCWNAAATGPGGRVYALYRDYKPSDMGLARSRDGGKGWQQAGRVGAFGWEFEGCPHVGGGLAVAPLAAGADARAEPALLATVWTGKEGQAGVHVLVSPDGGATWGEPTRVGGGATTGSRHSDAAALDARRMAVTWDADAGSDSGERAGEGRAIFASTSPDRGKTWGPPQKLSVAEAVAPTHPRLAALRSANGAEGGGFAVFWTETQAGAAKRGVVRAAVLR
ncbi:MAG: sialidase family protein [Planctomycetota bacterium]|nr:sialidase family protein [Planctomycetota bacterium]